MFQRGGGLNTDPEQTVSGGESLELCWKVFGSIPSKVTRFDSNHLF